ncbi:AAA domain protein [Mycobacteroides abscessus subsp. bolletii 1S-153-0915]|nr:AAA domain protein [Mycobacteroides abscessus subsp. bolletii 1S-153-0915]
MERVQEQPRRDALGVDYVEGDYLRPGERYEDDELSPDAEMREATERVLDFSGRPEPEEDEYAGFVLLGRSFVRSSEKKPTDWLFEPLFIAKHQHYVVGEKESNKSMLTLWVAVRFALNNDWGGQVLYLDEENDPGEIQDRLTDSASRTSNGSGSMVGFSMCTFRLFVSTPPVALKWCSIRSTRTRRTWWSSTPYRNSLRAQRKAQIPTSGSTIICLSS